MKCPFCGYTESKVIDSRPTDEGSRIRRRRECLSCMKRFTTYEIIESLPIIVVKKDKSREAFDRNKLLNGLLRACQKRPVSIETLEKAVDDIEVQIQNSLDREVTATRIGEYAMEKLKAAEKKGDMTEDDRKDCEKELQDMTDKYCKELDEMSAKKEKELMAV